MGLWTLLKSGLVLDIYFFKNNRAQLVSMFAWPYILLALMLGMGFLFGSAETFKSNVGVEADPVVFFIASTLVAMASMSVMWEVGGTVLYHRWIGTLPYVLIAPYRTSITLVMSYVPRYLLWSFMQLAEFIPVLVWREGLVGGLTDTLVMGLAIVVGMLPLLGFAAIFSAFLLTIKEETNILGWLNPIILILSGAFYPAYLFPAWARLLSMLLPTTYTFELARLSSLLGAPKLAEMTFLIAVLFGMSFLYNALSFTLMGKAESRALRSGAV